MQSLTVPGNLHSLEPIRDSVRAAAGAVGLQGTELYRLLLAVDEVATNIVMHGYDEAGIAGMIDLWFEIEPDSLKVYMEDTGAPYNPENLRIVDVDQPLDDRKEGGLGVFLAIRGVDNLEYANTGGRNRHTFVVKRHPSTRRETPSLA